MSTGTKGQIAAGQAVIVVTIDNQIQNGLKKIESSVRKFASGIGQIGFDLFRGGLLGSIPVFASTKEFTEFEDEILRLGTKLQTTDKQLKRVEDRIRSLGKTTSFTALEVAQGATSLAQAGFKPTEVISGLQSVLDLGRGAKITLDESADLLANTSVTFRLPVSDFPEIASQFIAAARLSTIEVINLKEAIKEASGTLNDLNIDLPTSLALLSQLGFRSLKGTKAGTTLNTMLLNLVAKMKQIGKVLKVEVGNIDGTMRPILDVLDDFSKKIKELPETQRIALSQRLFNIRGSRGETALREIDKIRALAKEIKNAGNEARLAAIKMDSGLGGSTRRATSAINDLAISLGKNLSPHLIKLLDIVPALAASIDEIVQKFPLLTTLVLALPPGILAAGTGLLVLSFTLGKLASVLGLAGSAVGVVGKNLRNLGGDISSGVGKATLTSISLLGRLDRAIAVSIFGSGRGRRKRPKSIFTASLSGPQLGKKTFAKVIGKPLSTALVSVLNPILKGKWISSLYKIFASVGTGISLLLKGALGFGKFLFSFNGIFQILSLLLIFGDKMTFTKNILDSLGRGFVAFGRSIGDIGRLIGPAFGQISSGFSLILGGEGGRGIEQIVAGLQNMASIIINQVLAGFNRLIVEISPGLEFLYGFFKSLWELLKLVGSTAASLANPLQEIGKNNQSSLSDKLSEIFSLSNMVEGFKELGLYVEGFATALANLAVQGFSFLGTAIQFLTDTMAALLGAIRDLVQSRNFGGVFNSEVASLSAATATVFQGGLQLNRDLQNVSKEMEKVPALIAASGTKFQEKMDTLEQEVAGSMKAAADARAKEQESIARRIANEATLANLYNDLIRGVSSLGAGALTAPQMSDNWSWARWDKIGNTGAEVLNRYTGKEINAEARSATKGINALGQLLPKPFIDGMKETLTNPTKTIGQGLAALANPLAALGNPLAEGAAAIGQAIADKASATTIPEMQGLYGAIVGSFQETRGSLMAVKTEPEKQTTLLKGIRRGLFDGEESADPLLKQIRDKDTTPKYE